MKVVLFDIDGTLLWTDGAGRRAVNRALEDVFGTASPTGHEFDGKTDPQIVRELMRLGGIAEETIDARLDDALEAHDDVLIGLLTGNVHDGAVAKLRAVGLARSRFKVGAFGSDHASRAELPAIARARAELLLGHAVAGEDVVVIGDTPADMSCGRGIGARAIGVATGRYSVDDLRACNAAAVFPDLSDTEAVMRAILGG